MVEHCPRSRNPKSGVVLIATLISLMLITGLAMVLHSAALANTRTFKRLAAAHDRDMDRAAVRELMRPRIGAAMMNPGQGLPLNGSGVELAYDGRRYRVVLQAVEGLVNPYRTPPELARALLPLPWDRIGAAIRDTPRDGRALPQLVAIAGGTQAEIRQATYWLTLEGDGALQGAGTLAAGYRVPPPDTPGLSLTEGQTRIVGMDVR